MSNIEDLLKGIASSMEGLPEEAQVYSEKLDKAVNSSKSVLSFDQINDLKKVGFDLDNFRDKTPEECADLLNKLKKEHARH